MASIRERIITALALTTGAARSRVSKVPAILSTTIRAFSEHTEARMQAGLVHGLTVLFVVTGPGDDASLDAELVRIHSAVMVDETVGGLATSITLSRTEWEYALGSGPECEARIAYEIEYETDYRNLATNG
jgi:hypothetical protein